jgi:ABC-type amino acid transport substrate-binding protein
LAGKRVAWMDGYNFEKGIPVDYEYQRISDQLQGLKLLQTGRIDYYLDNEYDIKRTIKKNNFDDKQYTMQPILENQLFVAFSKTQKSNKLMDLFDCRMDELRESGELEKLYYKWDIPMPPKD